MARKSRKTAATEQIYHVAVYIRTALYIRLSVEDNKLHAFLENASRWMKTRHKYGRMKAHGMRPAFYAATSARNKLVFALPLNHKLSMP